MRFRTQIRLCQIILVLCLTLVTVESQGERKTFTTAELTTALEVIKKNNVDIGKLPGDLTVPFVVNCIETNPPDFSNFKCRNHELRNVTLNEVILHSTLYKTHDVPCNSTPDLSTKLLNPPPQTIKNLNQPRVENFNAILSWQNELIDSGQIFCNPFLHLFCGPVSKKCECRTGLVWKSVPGICAFPLNVPCEDQIQPYVKTEPGFKSLPRYFYPLDSRGWIGVDRQTVKPNCDADAICFNSFYLLHEPLCVSIDVVSADHKSDTYFGLLPKMALGTTCDVEGHNQLYTISDADAKSPDVVVARMATLEKLQARGAKNFCDLKDFLQCGNSGKCECIPPAILPTGSQNCILPEEYNNCEMNDKTLQIFMNKSLTNWARREITQDALPKILGSCEPPFICHMLLTEMYCTCPKGKTGQKCDQNLTSLFNIVRILSFPTDVQNYEEKVKIFNELNKKALEFETWFKIQENAKCDSSAEDEAEGIIERVQNLELLGKNYTRKYYEDLTNSIDNFIGTGPALCTRERPLRGTDKMMMKCNAVSNTCSKEPMCNALPPDFCANGTVELQQGTACVCVPKSNNTNGGGGGDGGNPNPLGLSQNSTNVAPSMGHHSKYFLGVVVVRLFILSQNY